MATTAKKPAKAKNVTIGFVGTKKLTAKALAAKLDDVIAANPKATYTFVVPSSKGYMNEHLGAIVDYAGGKGIDVEAVHTEADLKSRTANIKGIITDASVAYKVKNVPLKLVNILAKEIADGNEAQLFVLFDESDEATVAVMDKATEKEVPMTNLITGEVLEPVDEDEEEEEDEESEDEDEETETETEAEDEDEEEDDDDEDEEEEDDDAPTPPKTSAKKSAKPAASNGKAKSNGKTAEFPFDMEKAARALLTTTAEMMMAAAEAE